MPGHIKKNEGPDPDPDPWLVVTDELKVKLKAKPYDAKKSCWVPEKSTGGYNEGLIESTDGDKVTVKILGTDEVRIKQYNGVIIMAEIIFSIYLHIFSRLSCFLRTKN